MRHVQAPARRDAGMRRLALLAAALLPGCLGGPAPQAQGEGAPAPEWRVGDAWNYTVTAEGTTDRFAHHEVTAADAEHYAVRVTTWRPNASAEVEERRYDRATLGYEVLTCGGRSDAECGVRVDELAFPLREGKAWTTGADASDVVVLLEAEATRIQGGWSIRYRPQACAACGETLARFDDEARNVVEKRVLDPEGAIAQRWILQGMGK